MFFPCLGVATFAPCGPEITEGWFLSYRVIVWVGACARDSARVGGWVKGFVSPNHGALVISSFTTAQPLNQMLEPNGFLHLGRGREGGVGVGPGAGTGEARSHRAGVSIARSASRLRGPPAPYMRLSPPSV